MDAKHYELLLERMDDQKNDIAEVKKAVVDGFAQMNGRVRKTETDIVRIKTILGITGSAAGLVSAFIMSHWSGVKAWLISP
jgi:hypothetical protein